MKYILLFTFCILSVGTYAQNALFIPFGQTETEVETFLKSKDYIKEVEFINNDSLHVVIHRGRELYYYFKDGFLYSIEEKRVFLNQKDKAKETLVKSCIDYLKATEEKVKALKTEGVDSHYAVAPDDRVLEFTVTESGKRKSRQIAMSFKSTSRNHGPRMDVQAFAAEIED